MSEVTDETGVYGTTQSKARLQNALEQGDISIAVYGLGKMGLPLAAVYAETFPNVTGADVDPDVVETVNRGGCHITGEPGLGELVADLVEADALRAVGDPRVAAEQARVHVIIVPTPITEQKDPDLSILDSVCEDIAHGLSPGDLVVVECTVPPRTTQERVTPLLEQESGLEVGEFGVAFCPERTSSGRAIQDIRGAYPKVVGGVDAESTRVASLIYDQINTKGVIDVSDATTAEAVKVFEGLYRDVNIALANELATFTDELGIDVNEAITVANTQPYCDIHQPGPGVGGHCIPYYPYFMIRPFETEAPLLETARSVNDAMPAFTVEKIREELAAEGSPLDGARVLVLGLTYRPGVNEIRASPSLAICESLSAAGAEVFGVDPVLDDFEAFAAVETPLDAVPDLHPDVVVMVTPHDEFDQIDWSEIERDNGTLIVIDGRQTLDLTGTDHRIYTLGSGHDVYGKHNRRGRPRL